ncbi:MAG: hypothetical protein JNK54_10385 [Elusimicrobia bacterium]|nr:hypothetical protein [Elusimicrobiota bacterium]
MVDSTHPEKFSFLRWFLVTSFIIPAITTPGWAFNYTQDISIDKPGLIRCFLPTETSDNYRAREELRLFSPEGQEIPYLFESPDFTPISLLKMIPTTSMKTQILEDKTIVTFTAPDSFPVSGFSIYTGVQEKKIYSIDRTSDGQTWDTLVPPSQMSSSARIRMATPPPGTTFRLTLDDSMTPPSSRVNVQWVQAPSSAPTMGKEEIPFKRTGTSDFGDRFELTAPRRNIYAAEVAVYVDDMTNIDLNNIRQTTVNLPSNEERPVYSHMTAIAQMVAPGKGQPPYLMVSMGVAGNDTNSVLYLKSHNGAPIRVRRMEACVMPLSILFQAQMPGDYKLRFGIDGPATDPVLIYGSDPINALRQRRNESEIRLASMGPIQTHKVVAEAKQSTGWDPLSSNFNPEGFSHRETIRVLQSGIQSADIPANIFGVSHTGDDWRLTSFGREIPFLIRPRSGQTIIKTSFKKIPSVQDKARWVLEGTFDQVPSITIRFDVKGLSEPTRARLISPSPMGEKVILETPWRFDEYRYTKFMSESGKTFPVKREEWATMLLIGSNGVPVTGNRLILEVDDPSFSLPEPTVSGITHKIIFKATPEDEVYFYCGDTKLPPPNYSIRADPKIPMTVADQSAYFVPESLGMSVSKEEASEDPSQHKELPIPNPTNRNKNSLWVVLVGLFCLCGVGYVLLKK